MVTIKVYRTRSDQSADAYHSLYRIECECVARDLISDLKARNLHLTITRDNP